MSTTSETKKLVAQVGSSLTGLSRRLEGAKGQFEGAKRQAENVVRGSATDIEQTLVAKLKEASDRADEAQGKVAKAAEACNNYASQTL